VEAPRRPQPADPDFDPAPAAPVRLRDFDPLELQRVVVNPFLAAFLLVEWLPLAGWLHRGPFPPLAVLSAGLLGALPWLIQYHCLDCGRTGSYPNRRRHACPGVFVGWNERRRHLFPSARTQLVIWAYLIGAGLLLLAVSG